MNRQPPRFTLNDKLFPNTALFRSEDTELASIFVGSFLLAATGLLDGKKATTNWMFADLFQKKYPQVILESDKIIVDQGRIYTCGGAFSFTDRKSTRLNSSH